MTEKYTSELAFEKALVSHLVENCGWKDGLIDHPTADDLVANWAQILFENNNTRDRLNGHPLTDGEMGQVLAMVKSLKTPARLNGFINGKTVTIRRDNPDDPEHLGKPVSLKIYDRNEIAGGESRYQIAEQPHFPTASPIDRDRRGDVMLLINGMPVMHIELKRSGVSCQAAVRQIKKYSGEGVFAGIFSLVQMFVAMEPEETLYFANPGPGGDFNPKFQFHWEDFDNELVDDWRNVARYLLSIPMAHQMIGFYSVADGSDGVLKIMRSYQCYAAKKIADKVQKHDEENRWGIDDIRGGHIWHTTGSGKTMTSYKSAQLIADARTADKVVFLLDRRELGVQSLDNYRNFVGVDASDEERKAAVQATEDTQVLAEKLKSDDMRNMLIVSSIQKMSRIREDAGFDKAQLDRIRSKRIVIIIDECHRDTFGAMMEGIKDTFPDALLFGFSGTPIQEENQVKLNTTEDVFGKALHVYGLADGIRDGNVLGFDTYKVLTFKDADVRKAVARRKANVSAEDDYEIELELEQNPEKARIYRRYMDKSQVHMTDYRNGDGEIVHGIESEIKTSQYRSSESRITDHSKMVVKDIIDKWASVSRAGKFHAIFATSSIVEAVIYYRMLKMQAPHIKCALLVDASDDDDSPMNEFKQDGIKEALLDYRERYDVPVTLPSYGKYKVDVASRMAHKKPYIGIENDRDKQVDIVIVVDQMLTGFDSKWVNALYLDKYLEHARLVQAFSRTNRVFNDHDKPFGTIRYYRKPHTMEESIYAAVDMYAGGKAPRQLFASKLGSNIDLMNAAFDEISAIFRAAGIDGFMRLPDDEAACRAFAKAFVTLSLHLDAAKIQGFRWGKLTYELEEGGEKKNYTLKFDERTFNGLLQRYKELSGVTAVIGGAAPFDIDGYLTEIDTRTIDNEYMNENFNKWLKERDNSEAAELALSELHRAFATLSQEQQKYAELFLHDVESGDVYVEQGETFMDYVLEYQRRAHDDRIHRISAALGADEGMLREMMALGLNSTNLNQYGRFDALVETVQVEIATAYFEKIHGSSLKEFRVRQYSQLMLRDFILQGGFDID